MTDDIAVMSAVAEQQAELDGVDRSGKFWLTDVWRRTATARGRFAPAIAHSQKARANPLLRWIALAQRSLRAELVPEPTAAFDPLVDNNKEVVSRCLRLLRPYRRNCLRRYPRRA